MKRIIPYKLFESFYLPPAKEFNVKEIEQYMTDILQELIDNGATVNINRGYINSVVKIDNLIFCVEIHPDIQRKVRGIILFKYTDILDYIISLVEYMRSVNYEIDSTKSCLYNSNGDFLGDIKDRYENLEKLHNIETVLLYFRPNKHSHIPWMT